MGLYDLVKKPGSPNNMRAIWLEEKFYISTLGWTEKKRALDIACADGVFAQILARYVGEVDAVDINLIIRDECQQKNINYIQSDIFKYKPKNNRRYDLIFCGELCEHLPFGKPEELMKLILKWLKKDGYLILTVPNFLIKSGGHLRTYSEKTMLDLVKDFEVIDTAYIPVENPLFHCCVCRKK
jgi:2-polyprenyl-3-methyl-5-hydroxy-6-metoxy-1,4-benzoquinol methylase